MNGTRICLQRCGSYGTGWYRITAEKDGVVLEEVRSTGTTLIKDMLRLSDRYPDSQPGAFEAGTILRA